MMATSKETVLISPAEAENSRESALFLDVRTSAEFEEAHIAGSTLQPLAEIDPEAVRKLAVARERCVVICRSGNRARRAAKKLSGAGIPNLCVLDGGVLAWEAAGLPLVRGRKTMSLERQVRIVAGALVLAGVTLGCVVNPLWFALSGFVGAGLVFAGITGTCGMGMLLARMPWNARRSCRDR